MTGKTILKLFMKQSGGSMQKAFWIDAHYFKEAATLLFKNVIQFEAHSTEDPCFGYLVLVSK